MGGFEVFENYELMLKNIFELLQKTGSNGH